MQNKEKRCHYVSQDTTLKAQKLTDESPNCNVSHKIV